MGVRVVSQKRFVRGTNSTTPNSGQVPGSLPRLSNMLFTVRGGLRTCDGTLLLSEHNGVLTKTEDPLLDIFYYQPAGASATYFAITKDTTTQLAAPGAPTLTAKNITNTIAASPGGLVRSGGVVTVTLTAVHNMDTTYIGSTIVQTGTTSVGGTGFGNIHVITAIPSTTSYQYNDPLKADDTGGAGTAKGILVPATTYSYRITALDGAGGETTLGTATAAALAALNTVNKITWTAVTYATGYNVYGRTAGSERLLLDGTNTQTVSGAPASPTYYDFGNVSPSSSLPNPSVNNTQVAEFINLNVPATANLLPGSWTSSNIVKTLPADLPPVDGGGGGGGTGGGGSSGGSTGAGATSVGGVTGNISPIPQIVQFTNKMVLALGNGLTPYLSDGTAAGTAAITNTFVPSYPKWIASTAYNVGDVITPTASNGHLFKCVTAGSTAAAEPAWPTTTDKTVANGSTIWKEAGSDTATNPPAGAAHAIAHAGSLWVFNTSPTNTSDGLDGPSALRMSDVNNPKSWNPLNAAFVGKDDGSQGMGIAAFTIAEAGIPPTGTLVCFKEFSTYQVNGVFGSTSFSIQQVQSDMGCIAPRSIQFLPGFGIARLSHLGVALFDGVRDRVISEEIRPYLFGGQADINPLDWNYAYLCKAAQVANPPMYCLAVPLQTGLTIGSLGGIGITAGTASPGNDLYIQVSALNSLGEVSVTPITHLSNVGDFNLSGLAASAGIVKYRVYSVVNAPTGSSITNGLYFDVPAGTGSLTNALSIYNVINTVGSAPTSIHGMLTRVFCYDLVLKAWSVVDLPFPIYTLKQIRAAGTQPITLMGGARDGALRRWQAGESTWDAGATNEGAASTAVNYSFRSPEVFNANPTDRVYFRRLLIRGVVNNGTSGTSASLSVKVTVDGTDQPTIVAKEIDLGSGQFESAVDIGVSGLNANATISGSGLVEIDSVDWHAVPKPAGALQSIQ